MTSLTWGYSDMTEIPPVLSSITTLQELDLSKEFCLRVGPASAKPLLELEHLTTLKLLQLNEGLTHDVEAGNQDFANSLPQSCAVQWCEPY